MHIEPNRKRLRRLRDLQTYPLKSMLIFCPDCDFQEDPQTVGMPQCPECGERLHHITVSDELLSLTGTPQRG
jgi:Zn finger protein HypA/HybF involved in hydrogenase expression